MKTSPCAVACLTLLLSGVANSQVYYPPCNACGGCPAVSIYAGSPHHASTAAESYARGYAELVRAQAEYNVLTSQARLTMAKARELEMQNRVAQTETYFRLCEMNRDYRHPDTATETPRPSIADRGPAVDDAARTAEGNVQGGGHLVWPEALRDDMFQTYRSAVERVLAQSAYGNAMPKSGRSKITRASRAMTSRLRDRIHEYSAEDYREAQSFLAALCFQADASR